MSQLNLEVTLDGTTATLNWTLKGARPSSEYRVIRDSVKIATTPNTVFTYTDASLAAGAVYTYLVRGVSGNKIISTSNSVEITVPPSVVYLTAPVLTATSGVAQVSLSWTAVPSADSYSWQRATGAGAFGTSTHTDLLSVIDNTVVADIEYRYRVRGTASAGANTGPWSNITSVTPTDGVPDAPTLTGTAGDSENSLDWNSVANAATYRLRRQVGTNPMDIFNMAGTDFIDDSAVNDITYQYTVRGITADNQLGAVSDPVDLTPTAAAPPEPPAIVGYAGVASVTGGAGGTTYNVSTFAELRAKLELSGPRIINITGSGNLNGNGADFTVVNGNVTVDGTNWTGSMKDYSIQWRCSNVILRQLAWRPGEGATGALSTDRRAVTFNPTPGETISRILLDRCSFAWGPDVIASWLNETTDVTAQFCIFGPALYRSNIIGSTGGTQGGGGYGPNITDTTSGEGYVKRITFYRCAMIMNVARNFRAFAVDGWDVVNCVVYDFGQQMAQGNPRGANIVGNIFKRGPESSTTIDAWKSFLGGANAQTWHLNSVYFPTAGVDRNIGLTRTNASFPLTVAFQSGTRLPAAYDSGPGAANHGALTVATPDVALFEAIVEGAGRTHQDPIDTLIKQHALDGTSDGFYNGAGYPAPHPSW